MPETTQWTIRKEMGISHKELFRKLPLVFKGGDYQVDGNRVSFANGHQKVEILISEELRRKLGIVSLPITHVELNLSGYDASEKSEFIHHFDIQYFRGGG